MADAFVSYQREDQERADLVVRSLSSEGLAVWWDQMIPPGANWSRTIETEIVQARSVVVLWSNASVASENVHCEAEFARNAGILVPAKIATCELPFFHRMTQCVELQTWSGEKQHPAWRTLVDRVRTNFAKDPRADLESWGFGIAPPKPQTWRRYNAAVRSLLQLLRHAAFGDTRETLLSSISEVKGLFNRIQRKDQWDWFIVWQRFGLPPISQLRPIVEALGPLRAAIKATDEKGTQEVVSRLTTIGVVTLLLRFLGEEGIVRTPGEGVVFVLSAKYNPETVLVSTTTDDVVMVADQLSERLGAFPPFGIIHAWPVKDTTAARRIVFSELTKQGFSSALDRVLVGTRVLDCDYRKAVPMVDSALSASGLLAH